MLDLTCKLLETCAQLLAVEFHLDFQWKAAKFGNANSPICGYFKNQIAVFCMVNGFLCVCVCSSRKSASRLICRIASSTITTRAPHSVTTVEVCYGVSTDKALNVKVSLIYTFIFTLTLRCYTVSAFLILTFFSFIVPFLHLPDPLTRLWDERT